MTPAAKRASDADEVLTTTPAPTWETAERFANRSPSTGMVLDSVEAWALYRGIAIARDRQTAARLRDALDSDDPFTAARALLADLGGAP